MASIYQARKGGGWTAQVNIGGKRRSKTFQKKTEANRWARRQEAEIDEAGPRTRTASNTTFNDVIAAYLDEFGEKSSRSKLGTITHISELVGRVRLADLTVQKYIEFAKQRAAEGAGPATIGQDLSYIHTLLSTGGPLAEAPTGAALAAYVGARRILGASGRISRPRERDRRPTDAELVKLRDFWSKRRRGIPMWTLTRFACATAMRLSEITRIRWEDLDEVARTVTIRNRKHPRAKAGNDQAVPLLIGPCVIAGDVVDPLSLIRDQRREEARIFPYSPATVSTSFTRAVASCQIEDLRMHDLRHDGVSRLFEAGYDIPEVSLVSGHKDWNQLRRYTQLKPEALHRDE